MKSEDEMKSIKDILAMVKHPKPTVAYNVFGLKCIFSYSILHLSLMSFMFTYLNIVTLFEFGVYPTLMTGNYFNMALDFSQDMYQAALYRLSLIVTCTLMGTALDCMLLIKLQSRSNAFAVLMCLLVPIVVFVDVLSDSGVSGNEYSLCLLCVTSGALVHWSQKLGYTCTAMTGNMFKMAELLFVWFCGYTERGPKLYGEAVILGAIFASSLVGAVLAVFIIYLLPESWQLIPLLCCVPPNLYFAGCFHEWGWIARPNPMPVSDDLNQNGEDTKLSNVMSVMHTPTDSDKIGDSGDVDNRRSRSSISEAFHRLSAAELFTPVSISEEEAKQCEEIENAQGYKREKSMYNED